MNDTDKEAFIKLLQRTAEIYEKTLSKTQFDNFWIMLRPYDLTAIQEAIQQHIQNTKAGRFMPQVADLLYYLKGDVELCALHAWDKANLAISQVGAYDSIVFDDPLIHRVILAMGGWIRFCEITEKEKPFRAREFTQRYIGYLHCPTCNYPRELVGIMARENGRQGYKEPSPVLFGNASVAQHVYLEGVNTYCFYSPRISLSALLLEQETKKISHSVDAFN